MKNGNENPKPKIHACPKPQCNACIACDAWHDQGTCINVPWHDGVLKAEHYRWTGSGFGIELCSFGRVRVVFLFIYLVSY